MSDTSLVFNLLGRDNVSRVLGVIRGAFTSAGRTAETAMDKANVSTERLDRQIQETERHLAELNREFAETGDKTLFGKMARDRQLLSQLRRVRDEITKTNEVADRSNLNLFFDQFRDGTSGISRAVSAVGGFGSTVAGAIGPIGSLVGMLAAAAGAFAAIGPAVSLAGGAIGSLPGVLAGGAAAIGTLKLGLFGLGSEYKRLTTATGGSGGAAQAAKQMEAANRAVEQAARAVARAERDVRDAQKDALRAQQAINDARAAAADRMRDQAMDLEDARLSEADAVDELEDATRELDEARASGDPEKIDDAQRAYDRAALAVKRAKDRTQELTEANAENAKKGVEGSDEVVAAKEREADARRRVTDAQEAEREAEERLADARKARAEGAAGGGGGGAGEQITKLAPAARQFLNTIIGLRPAFDNLRLDVQQRLFAGLAGPVRGLAERWMPQLHTTLGNFAATLNGIGKTAIDSLGKKSFIDNMAKGADSARKALGEVGKAAAGPLVDAFGRLARASGPFLEKIGHLLAGVIEKFSGWIKKADESGKLDRFFKGAADTLGKVWDVGGKVVKVVGQFVGIIFGQSKKAGDSVLDSASAALTKVSDWLSKSENQQKIRDFVAKIGEWGKAFQDVMKNIDDLKGVVSTTFKIIKLSIDGGIANAKLLRNSWELIVGLVKWIRTNGPKAWDGIKSGITSAYNWVTTKGGQLIKWVGGLPGRISNATRGMWDGIKNAFKSALNWVIGKWNNLKFPLPDILGGGAINLPDVDYLAQGGIVPATPGGRLIVAGEGGEDEAVIPLSKLGRTSAAAGGVMRGELTVKLDFGDSELGKAMARTVRTQPAVAAAMGKHLKVWVTA